MPSRRLPLKGRRFEADSIRSESGKAAAKTINKGLRSVRFDSLLPEADKSVRYSHLTEEDFRMVAEELGVEVAAGHEGRGGHRGRIADVCGFWAPGVPVINFDRAMYNKFRRSATSKAGAKGRPFPQGLPAMPGANGPSSSTPASPTRKVRIWARSRGMFQIGGFNYKLCGCQTVDEFVRLMAYSELEQLELFAAFITNTGMVEDLRKKNWRGFARKYNGASYARRGYHTKMANAYAKYKKQENQK